jgi:hypothetical protein
MPAVVELPLPPSVNVRPCAAASAAASAIPNGASAPAGSSSSRNPRASRPVAIIIAADMPDRRRRDVDNLPKAILDLRVAID